MVALAGKVPAGKTSGRQRWEAEFLALSKSNGSPLGTSGDGHSYYGVKGNLRFMSGNNYSHVTSARHRVGDGSVDGAQVRRRAFAGTMTNGRRRVGFPVCVLERKLSSVSSLWQIANSTIAVNKKWAAAWKLQIEVINVINWILYVKKKNS